MDTGDRLLTPGEVAALFRVDPKTVTRWAAAGRIRQHPYSGRASPVPGVRGARPARGGGHAGGGGRESDKPRSEAGRITGPVCHAACTELVRDDARGPDAKIGLRPAIGATAAGRGGTARGADVGSDRAAPSRPAQRREQGVRHAERVEHLAGHEVDQLLGGGRRARP